MRVVSVDGALCAPEDAKVSVYDRGFLYGDSVFETVRTYAGKAFALREHLDRLVRSAERVAIPMPISTEALTAEIEAAVSASKNEESIARIMLTRGAGPLGLDPNLAGEPLRVILVEPLLSPPRDFYADGIGVITVRTERAADAAPGAKVGNYLGSLLALRDARAKGAHEALILDTAGRVVEGTTSNVFVVRGGELITPPEDAAILAGITRSTLIAIASELGITVRFEHLLPGDFDAVDEAFLSSSIREVIPIVWVDEQTIGDGRPGPVTRRMHRAFRAHVGCGDLPMPWEEGASPGAAG